MTRRTVAFVCMPEFGHLHRIRAVIAGVAGAGARAVVFTDARFRGAVQASGGEFRDLFADRSLAAADDESTPAGLRYVSYAGHFGAETAEALAADRPDLVVCDTFSVVGRVAAGLLGLPFVNVCAGHNVQPAVYLDRLSRDPRVRMSERCHGAVRRLKEEFGLADASPFAHVTGTSPHLNVYGEPPEYLSKAERAAFEPIAFFGSLPTFDPPPTGPSPFGDAPRGARRVYVSFGTVIWRYFAPRAMRSLRTLVEFLADREDTRVLIGLGGTPVDAEVRDALARPNVRVESWVDQWRVLHEADLFVTHQGLNSTHEAAWCRVPMLSHPFFWDQPELAARAGELGIACPLATGPGAEVGPEAARTAFDAFAAREAEMRAHLDVAREFEARVAAGRSRVVRRILDLV